MSAKVRAQLRLYVARATPNSARAEQNLAAAILALEGGGTHIALEVINVFATPKRALTDGVIVTPTLIGVGPAGRQTLMGDLTDQAKLRIWLETLVSTLEHGC